ncbi:MAG TPA: pyruvate, phosphate dikinase [Pseudonocardiaceae bacterium]|nr:pyruvate, phosphate dikinase [Pseudonocardiaceae bacterium]
MAPADGVDPADMLILDGTSTPPAAAVGGKAAGIARMAADGLPVPPAFVLGTGSCREFLAEGEAVLDRLWPGVRAGMAHLERVTRRRFGDPRSPLLVSVRSGAPTSMPGMMDTVLNLGFDDGVERGLARAVSPEHARDTRRRFERQFGAVVGGAKIPADPWRQLRTAIAAVFGSWHSARAVAYRARHGLDEHAGTAVTVQAMVYGNADARSGTGVLFSRDPATGAAEPLGEWLAEAQGEDVVSGDRSPRPLSDLAGLLPEVHARLLEHAAFLERRHRDVQDIEFTVERGQLWLLQTRSAKRSPRAAIRFAAALAREGVVQPAEAVRMVSAEQVRAAMRPGLSPTRSSALDVLARGLPVCPGVGSGVLVTDPDEAEARAARGESVVLARRTTSPHDLPGMLAATAIVTEVGGATSHAAVVSRELGVPCVVGCGEGSLHGHADALVTVCGDTGEVVRGTVPLAPALAEDSDPDLRELTRWARQVSPLQVWRPGEGPAGARADVALATAEQIRMALSSGVRAVVTEHPLPVLLTAVAFNSK